MRQTPHQRIIMLEQRIQILLDELTKPHLSESERQRLILEIQASSEALTHNRQPSEPLDGYRE